MDFENMAKNILFEALDMDSIGAPEEEKQKETQAIKRALEKIAVLSKEPDNTDFDSLLGALSFIFDV